MQQWQIKLVDKLNATVYKYIKSSVVVKNGNT